MPRDLIVATENTFEINLENAGNVPLEIKITSPTGVNGENVLIERSCLISFRLIVPLKVDDASSRVTAKKVRFTPTETGVHYLNARFGSEPVPGMKRFCLLFSRIDHLLS